MKIPFGISGLAAILASVLILAGCSGGSAGAQGGTYSPTVVTPTVSGDTVSVSGGALKSARNLDFSVKFDQGTANYMAYVLNGVTQVRASVCVPCQGRTFTLKGTTLVCNTCGTLFSAQTGAGIGGVPACKNYPKASVPFTTGADGNINMKKADLLTAYTNTLTPGLP